MYTGYIQLGQILNVSIQKGFFVCWFVCLFIINVAEWAYLWHICWAVTLADHFVWPSKLKILWSRKSFFSFFLVSGFDLPFFFWLHMLYALLQRWTELKQSYVGTWHEKVFCTLLFWWFSEYDGGWGLVLILSFHNSRLTKTLSVE